MNREKVIELAKEVGFEVHPTKSEVRIGIDAIAGLDSTTKLERFAALIEREVRGDAESVASVHIKDGCLIGSQRKSGVDIPDGQYGLYPIGTSPDSAVVRQLVDGLAGLIDFIEIDNLKIDQDALRIARVALAAAKENGL